MPARANYRFDSLPREAAALFAGALDSAGLADEMTAHESTAVLELPSSFDDYLANIGKKERHETRRKLRRFEQSQGPARIVTYTEPGPALMRFARLHRLADGSKSAFMTAAMTRLFVDLVSLEGWQVDVLYGDGPGSLAATVSFVDKDGYYLYNSAYDPAARDSSPGVVLLTSLISRAIDQGLAVFDFLKGDEQYKYRMGGGGTTSIRFRGHDMIERVAYLSMHTSPLDLPGVGNAGGMNVYIDELAATMVRRGVEVAVFTRRTDPSQPVEITTESGYRVVHIDAGPARQLEVGALPEWVKVFAGGVVREMRCGDYDLVHSHYWLSGWAGLIVKQSLDLALANSFHTLGRVKDAARRPGQPLEPLLRLAAESELIASSDCVIASTEQESDEMIDHYGADPGRLCVNPPGIDRDLFKPGDRDQARAELGLGDEPFVLFRRPYSASEGEWTSP